MAGEDYDVPNWLIDFLGDFDFWSLMYLFPDLLFWAVGAVFYVLFWVSAEK